MTTHRRVPVRKHLRREPIKIREAPIVVHDRVITRPVVVQRTEGSRMQEKYRNLMEDGGLSEAQERQMRAMMEWQEWRGWTLEPFVEHKDTATYIKEYDAGRYRGEAVHEYRPAEGDVIYYWRIRDMNTGEVVKFGYADSLMAARRKADNVYNSLPYVSGWSAARKGRRMKFKGGPWADGYRDYQAWMKEQFLEPGAVRA